jgi:REP element-mobilizing transposase RayT
MQEASPVNDADPHHRRSVRLKGWDYTTAGAYFVTICTQGRAPLFGCLADGTMTLNDAGRMVDAAWRALPARFPSVEVGPYVIMPDHLHALVILHGVDPPPTAGHATATTSLAGVVGALKSITTDEYARRVHTGEWPPFVTRLWQRGYYEHVARDDKELGAIAEYIANNPVMDGQPPW